MPKVALSYLLVWLFALTLVAHADPVHSPSAIIAAWRQAVHASTASDGQTAHVKYSASENGVFGTMEQWVTRGGLLRRSAMRQFDHDEILVTDRGAQSRDWNEFLRDIDGTELQRLRSEAFNTSVIAFGPSPAFELAAAGESQDHTFWTLRLTPPGGIATTWYIDRQTMLPGKSVVQGSEGGEITTTYGDWRVTGGTFAPQHLTVSEPEKPASEFTLSEPMSFSNTTPAAFAALVPGSSDVAMTSDVVTMPFTLEANHIVLPVQLNGRPPIGFIFDTGDDHETINTARLAEFGLSSYGASQSQGGGGSAGSAFVQDATFAFPGVELRHQHATVLDLSGLEHALGIKVGGLLGYDFISRFVLEIDFQAKLLTLHRPESWRYSGHGAVVPITFDEGIPYVDAFLSVPTKPHLAAHMVVDFGAADTMTLTSPFVKANDLIRLAGTNITVNKPAGLEHEFFAQNNMRGHIDELRLGDIVVARSIPVSLSANTGGAYASAGFAGTIGNGIYNRYHVFLDYTRHRMILEPTAKSDAAFEERRTFGLTLVASGTDLHTYNVTAVRPGSPAEALGFKKDDVVAGLDGKSAAQFALAELRDWLTHEGERHVFHVTRAGQDVSIAATITLVSIDRKPSAP